MTVRQIELGADAIAHIRSSLAQGKTLARNVARLPLDTGTAVALLPEEVDPQAARRFHAGGVAHTRQTEPAIARLVSEFLGGAADRLAVFEDAIAQPTDPSLAQRRLAVVTCGVDVLYLVTRDAPSETIIRALRFATSHVLLGVLTTAAGAAPHAGDAISDAMLAELAARTDKLLIGAYDGESVIVWSRRA